MEAAFELPYEFTVPDLLYKRELQDYNGPELQVLGLRVEELDGDGVALAIAYREEAPSLSLADAFALSLAKTNGFTLLSGDRTLRELAGAEEVVCHGVLWVLEQMHARTVRTAQDLHSGLTAISDHPRCRLPQHDVKRLLAIFAAAFGAR